MPQRLQSQVEALEEEMVQLGPVQEEEIDVVVRRQLGRQACANIKESRAQALKELPDGFYVCEVGRSKAKRLHRLGYCRTKDHSCLGNTSSRKCASVAAQNVHTNATRQWVRLGSVHGHRLRYGCLLVCVVQSSVQPLQPPPLPLSFCTPLSSRRFSICLSLDFQFGLFPGPLGTIK